MSRIHPVPREFAEHARVTAGQYKLGYKHSIRNPERFWGDAGRRLDWLRPYTRVKDVSYAIEDFHIRWYEDGLLNAAANCLDRHLSTRGDKTAIIWEGDDPAQSSHLTYRELHERVCRFANALKAQGVVRGDRVTIYLPMIPEAAVAMLACARIGAVHSVVFGGFSPESLVGRIEDCGSKLVITADEGLRGGKKVPLKANVDAAAEKIAGEFFAAFENYLKAQQARTAAPATEAADAGAPESASPAEASAPAPAANALPWPWLIGGAVVLVAAAWLFAR